MGVVCRVKDEVGRRWISRAWRRGSLKLRSDVIRLSLCNMILLIQRLPTSSSSSPIYPKPFIKLCNFKSWLA